jgi:hypothetical protein
MNMCLPAAGGIGRSVCIAVIAILVALLSTCGSGHQPEMTQPQETCGSGIAQAVTPSQTALTKLSADTCNNASSQHATEVEPDTFAFGSTIVSAYQVARIFGGGGADIGFSTSSNGGKNWSSGLLPGITVFEGGSAFTGVSDASVAYDAKHAMWLISSLAIGTSIQVIVNRSPDGINWGHPIVVAATGSPDKNWIVCDNTASSPFYGHCYVEWDDPASADLIEMNTSSDGGMTWSQSLNTADLAQGIGGQPLVRPDGHVVVPILSLTNSILAFTSTDGGLGWSPTVTVSSVNDHAEDGGLRSGPLPSAEIDGAGTIYVVWSDCSFRANCAANDLVLSTSSDGVTWSAPPTRVPIDPITSTVDHFIPGLAVDPATSGATAHLTLAYYYYPVSNCGAVCQMDVGFVSSQDGGQSWTAAAQLAGPMSTSWLPNTFSGLMVADYISTSYVNGNAFAAFALAQAPSGAVFDQAIYTTTNKLAAAAGRARFSSKDEKPIPNAKSDHGPRKFYDEDGEFPIPPPYEEEFDARRKKVTA